MGHFSDSFNIVTREITAYQLICKVSPLISVQLYSSNFLQAMPYLLISTQIRLECGPTFVGDEWSDPKLMEYIGATKIKALGNNFAEWRTDDSPRLVLNKLEKKGYKVVAMTGVGQTCIWTLNKPEDGTN